MNMVGNFFKCAVIILISLHFSVVDSFSQNGDKGNVLIEGGIGVNGYNVLNNWGFGSTIAVSTDLNFTVSYITHKRVGFLAEYERHSYFSDPDVNVQFLGSNRVGVGLAFHIVNKSKFNMDFGMNVGVFDFEYSFITDNNIPAEVNAQGVYQKLNLTLRKMFGEKGNLGLFFKLGIINNPMQINSLKIDDLESETYMNKPINELILNSAGYYFKLGMTYCIKNKK